MSEPLSVSAYLANVNKALQTQDAKVKGEVTSVKVYEKAVYFSIKDKEQQAVLECIIFRYLYNANGINIKEGDEIIVHGTPNIYVPTGRFAFKTQTIEYAGEGALMQAYLKLYAQLKKEGLMAEEKKRPMPDFPKKIGLITSMSGVVIQDFSSNLGRHGFKITTIDSRVEGKDAIHELRASIATMAKQDIDVLVIIRGGGSLESLQAFNTESVVRDIANFKVPVITGIGHDVDVTLSELVADHGKSTPTAVAEALNEPWEGLSESLRLHENRIITTFRRLLNEKVSSVEQSSYAIFRTYERALANRRMRIVRSSTKLTSFFHGLSKRVRDANSSLLKSMGIMKSNLALTRSQIKRLNKDILAKYSTSLASKGRLLESSGRTVLAKQKLGIRATARSLPIIERSIKSHDPTRNLKLGYSLSYVDGMVMRNISDVGIGNMVTTKLSDGEFTSEVKEVK